MSETLDKTVRKRRKLTPVEKAAKARMLHAGIEAFGVAALSGTVTVLYGLMTFIPGNVGDNGKELLKYFVDHAVNGINPTIFLLSLLIFGIALIFNGARLSNALARYVARPALSLFSHSCAAGVGIGIGDLILIPMSVMPNSDLRPAIVFVVVTTALICYLIAIPGLADMVGRAACEKAIAKVIPRLLPKVARSPKTLRKASAFSTSLLFALFGLALLVISIRQLPADLAFVKHQADSCSPAGQSAGGSPR